MRLNFDSMTRLFGALILLIAFGMLAGCGANKSFIVAPMAVGSSDYSPQLFRVDPSGGTPMQLTYATGKGLPTDANDFPIIAPSKDLIYFASGRDHEPESVTHDWDPMYRTIYVMDSIGQNAHRLTKNSASDCTEYPNDVSPDGQWIVFEMACSGPEVTEYEWGATLLYKIKADGTGQTLLLASTDYDTSGLYNIGQAKFTPDGKTLLINISNGYSFELWKMNFSTEALTQLTNTDAEGFSVDYREPMIASDGKTVYYPAIAYDWSTEQIEKISIDGTGQSAVFTVPLDPVDYSFQYDRFALSPESNKFTYFVSNTDPETYNSTFTLVTSDLKGKTLESLTGPSIWAAWGSTSWR